MLSWANRVKEQIAQKDMLDTTKENKEFDMKKKSGNMKVAMVTQINILVKAKETTNTVTLYGNPAEVWYKEETV